MQRIINTPPDTACPPGRLSTWQRQARSTWASIPETPGTDLSAAHIRVSHVRGKAFVTEMNPLDPATAGWVVMPGRSGAPVVPAGRLG